MKKSILKIIIILLLIIVFVGIFVALLKNNNIKITKYSYIQDIDEDGKKDKILVKIYEKYIINEDIMDVNHFSTTYKIYINNKMKYNQVSKSIRIIDVTINQENQIVIKSEDGYVAPKQYERYKLEYFKYYNNEIIKNHEEEVNKGEKYVSN